MASFVRILLLPPLLALAVSCRPAGKSGAGKKPLPFAVAVARSGDEAGTELVVKPGALVVLDGSISGTDHGKVEISYSWRQASGPKIRIAREDLVRTELRLVKEGAYVFELVTSCAGHRSSPAPVTVTVVTKDTAQTDPASGGNPRTPPEAGPRTATFALLDSDAEELIRIFGAKTGLTLRVAPEWMRPEGLKRIPVTFMARKVTPGVALEMSARLLGARYIRDRSDAAFLARGLGWLRAERNTARFYPTTLIAQAGQGKKLLELVREGCRGALFACKGSSIIYDRRRDGLQLTGPASMHARVESLLAAIGSNQASLPGRPALGDDEKLERTSLRRRVDLTLVNRDFSAAALELGHALNVPLAWQENVSGKRVTPPRISCRGAGRGARAVLSEVARKAGFKGWEWVSGGGVWFYRTKPGSPARAHLWKTAVVRAYPLFQFKAKGVLAGAATHAIRKQVRPESWSDSSALCTYYQHTDKLVVINSPRVQREVLRALHELLEEKPAKTKL